MLPRTRKSFPSRGRGTPQRRFVFNLQVHHVDFLIGMSGPDVGHDVGCLLTAELAVGALEARWLATLVLEVSGHVTLDGEATAALGTTERLVRVPHLAVRIITVVAFGVEAFAGLQDVVEVQLGDRCVETWNLTSQPVNPTKHVAACMKRLEGCQPESPLRSFRAPLGVAGAIGGCLFTGSFGIHALLYCVNEEGDTFENREASS